MKPTSTIIVQRFPEQPPAQFEICEHKGSGHPDSIADGAAEAVSRALCKAYLSAYGSVQHYNVDKALLIGGQSAPAFGGGKQLIRPKLIICGRATILPHNDLDQFVCETARTYLADTLHCEPDLIQLESAVREGSPNLRRVLTGGIARANDTSFGAGFAPYSLLESCVLNVADVLRSADFRELFPAAGDDYKIMGARIGESLRLTIALALVDRYVQSTEQYFGLISEIVKYLRHTAEFQGEIIVNGLDDREATSADRIYITVTGLSVEHGDDGQVGRGNRVNGLITPSRPMSLEAAAGKNSVAHIGKLYNVLAHQIAHEIVNVDVSLKEVIVQILSTIGQPVNSPDFVAIQIAEQQSVRRTPNEVFEAMIKTRLDNIADLTADLIAGRIDVF